MESEVTKAPQTPSENSYILHCTLHCQQVNFFDHAKTFLRLLKLGLPKVMVVHQVAPLTYH